MTRPQDYDWIGALPEKARDAVLAGCVRVELPAGAMLYQRDATPNGTYRLTSGRARMFFLSPAGRERIVKISEPTETIGDLAMIDGKPRTLFSETITPCVFDFLPRDKFLNLRRAYPEIEPVLVAYLAFSLRQTLQFIEELTIHELPGRVALRIHWLAAGAAAEKGLPVEIPVAQADLALMVGASRQSINKVLGDLETFGAIEARYGTIAVKSLEKLRDFAAETERLPGRL